MGCSESQQESTIGEEYARQNLIQPTYSEYENEFEKQLFMAINLCRSNPKSFITAVKETSKTHVLCKDLPITDLVAYLKTCERLSSVTFVE